MEKKKLKLIKPSQRENRRYLLAEGNRENIEKAILDYIGILGWAKASPIFVKNILSISRKEVDNVRAALAVAGIKVKRVSGTLKGLE